MGWVRLDDGFFTHRKVVELSKDARLVFLAGLTHSAAQLTDGVLSPGAVRTVANLVGAKSWTQAKTELVNVGMWHELGHGCSNEDCVQPAPDAVVVHDYHRYQPTAADERKRLALARERTDRWRQKKGSKRPPDTNGDASRDASQDASVTPSVTHSPNPNPTDVVTPTPRDSLGVVDNGSGGVSTKNGSTDLVSLVAGACSGRKRDTVEREAGEVVGHLARYVDRRLIEEAATQAHEAGANLPRWFLPVVRSKAESYGITVPRHVSLEA